MADITISYKGATISEVSASGTTTLETAGKYCEDDITLQYVKSGGATPTNMITNGDFSVQGATTDGWYSWSPYQSTIAITGGKLVLTHTETSNRLYGVYYPINIVAGHSYLVRFKVTKTLSDSDSDGRYVTVRFLNGSTMDYLSTLFYKYPVTQDSIVESVGALTATNNYDKIYVGFLGYISDAASNESMLEMSYIELYDITDIVSGWTA